MTAVSEAAILSRVIEPERSELPGPVAEVILRWKFPVEDSRRMHELLEKAKIGKLTRREKRKQRSTSAWALLINLQVEGPHFAKKPGTAFPENSACMRHLSGCPGGHSSQPSTSNRASVPTRSSSFLLRLVAQALQYQHDTAGCCESGRFEDCPPPGHAFMHVDAEHDEPVNEGRDCKKGDQSPIAKDIKRDKEDHGAMQPYSADAEAGQIADERTGRQFAQTAQYVGRLHPAPWHDCRQEGQHIDRAQKAQSPCDPWEVMINVRSCTSVENRHA